MTDHPFDSPLTTQLTRRRLLWGGIAASGIVLLGCSGESSGKPTATPARKMVMHKDPNCGCCGKWAEAARAEGFDVDVAETSDIMAVKAKLGVPEALASCHTTLVGRYVLEGHVPFDAVKRLLRDRPNINGLAVPGMPAGTPGMETPDGRKDDFKVLAFRTDGAITVF